MLNVLQPIWLWAIAGIIIPVIIHLWHIKQGKSLKVGSVIFLQESSKQQSSSLKISDWLLLLLRCLLIILLAILLAKPQWQQALQTNKQKGWLLINNTDFSETYKHF
ncbi:MAG: BatA domain-containing protein, partial [Deinococcales bacterium]|nr:BatA domain-containing protein [Chitinophagaceae bacterium]